MDRLRTIGEIVLALIVLVAWEILGRVPFLRRLATRLVAND